MSDNKNKARLNKSEEDFNRWMEEMAILDQAPPQKPLAKVIPFPTKKKPR